MEVPSQWQDSSWRRQAAGAEEGGSGRAQPHRQGQAVQMQEMAGGEARGHSIRAVKVVSKHILQCGSSKGKTKKQSHNISPKN